MKCPICHIESLKPVSLDTGLRAHQCTNCLGHWISSEDYWEWLESRPEDHNSRPPITLSTGDALLPVVDNHTANFCADCSRLMTKSKVGRGLNFYLDRCGHCHGVWFDQNEWENIQQMNLHHQVHYMFSNAWQFSVRQERYTPQKAPA
ncbi:MAG: zf-TFIIB domain-containing protein [Cyanobacteria bacterium J06627_32]